MKLQNGFELEGNIKINPIKLNDIWTNILIVESIIEENELRELFKNNNIIIETKGDIETTYFTNGLIDVKAQDSKNYVWLYFVNSTIRELLQIIKADIEKLQQDKTDLQSQLEQSQVAMAELFETVASLQGTV